MRKHSVGLFPPEADATQVIEDLVQNKVDAQQISMVAAHQEQQTDPIAEIFRRNNGARLSYRKAE